ncbi:unnamed protein product, partial [Symbiodinium pilosum]
WTPNVVDKVEASDWVRHLPVPHLDDAGAAESVDAYDSFGMACGVDLLGDQ